METKKRNWKNPVFALAAILAFGLHNIALGSEDPTVTIAPPSGTTSYMAAGTPFEVSATGTPDGGEYKWSLSSTGGSGSLPDTDTDWSMNNLTELSSNDAGATHNVTVIYKKDGIQATATSGDIVPVEVRILQVPDYLFANATYYTPIKFEIVADSLTSFQLSDIDSVVVHFTVYKPVVAGTPEVPIVTMQFHRAESVITNYIAQKGTSGAAIADDNVFECYVHPSFFRRDSLTIPEFHWCDGAYFEITVNIKNSSGGTFPCSSYVGFDGYNAVVSGKFFDATAKVQDMDNTNGAMSVRSDLVSSSVSVKQWKAADWGLFDVDGKGVNSVILPLGLGYLRISPEVSAYSGTWEANDPPRLSLYSTAGELINDDIDLFDSSSSKTGLFENAGSCNAWIAANMANSGYARDRDFGTYTGVNYGARTAALVYLSYPYRNVVVFDDGSTQITEKVMDISRTTGTIDFQMAHEVDLLTYIIGNTGGHQNLSSNVALTLLPAVPVVLKILGIGSTPSLPILQCRLSG